MKIDSLRSRVMLHLAKYVHVDIHEQYGAPIDITQDGIAMALGITRSYASLVLSRMEKTGTVENSSSIVRSSSTNAPRKIYHLTAQGCAEYRDLLAAIGEKGLSAEDILASDVNHLGTDALVALPDDLRDSLGFLCAVRSPVQRKEMPGPVSSKVPFDVHGYSHIKEETKKRFMDASAPEDVRRYHSIAADWCTDYCKDDIYHLVRANRTREANRMVVSGMYGMIERGDRRSVPVLLELCVRGCGPELAETAARIAIENGMPDAAQHALDACDSMDECVKGAMTAEIELLRGHRDAALDTALDCYRGDGLTGLVLGKCMMACGRYGEAEVYLRRARQSMVDSGFVFDLEAVLSLEAETAARLGKADAASELLGMTECVMKRKSTAATLDRVRRILGSRLRS